MQKNSSIEVLAATPPPPAARKYHSFRDASRRIAELETSLGLPAGQTIYNIGAANRRVAELEHFAAIKTAPVALQSAPVATSPATPPPIAEVTLAALAKQVFKVDAKGDFASLQKQFTDAGLSVPGLTPAPPNPNFTPIFTGLARAVRGARQEKINKFFGIK